MSVDVTLGRADLRKQEEEEPGVVEVRIFDAGFFVLDFVALQIEALKGKDEAELQIDTISKSQPQLLRYRNWKQLFISLDPQVPFKQ